MKKYILLLVLMLPSIVHAQWKLCGKSQKSLISGMTASNNNIFAATYGEGVLMSKNNGNSWETVNNGLTNLDVQTIYSSDNIIYAGTAKGFFVSTDDGSSWEAKNTGLKSLSIQAITSNGNTIIAGTSGKGIFISTDNGGSWTEKNSGLEVLNVQSVAIHENSIFAGTDNLSTGGIFVSTDLGNSWRPKNTGLTNIHVQKIVSNGNTIFAGTNDGVFLSTNDGNSWIKTGVSKTFVNSLAINENITVAGTTDGIFLSTNEGVKWTQKNSQLTELFVISTTINGSTIFAGAISGEIFKSTLSELTDVDEGTNTLSDNLQVFPQPALDIITINCGKNISRSSEETISIFNTLGEKVKTITANTSQILQINISELSLGIYYLSRNNEIKMFVKQ